MPAIQGMTGHGMRFSSVLNNLPVLFRSIRQTPMC